MLSHIVPITIFTCYSHVQQNNHFLKCFYFASHSFCCLSYTVSSIIANLFSYPIESWTTFVFWISLTWLLPPCSARHILDMISYLYSEEAQLEWNYKIMVFLREIIGLTKLRRALQIKTGFKVKTSAFNSKKKKIFFSQLHVHSIHMTSG